MNQHVVLGFDFGIKNIGVAVGNTLTMTAQPICILKAENGQPEWCKIDTLIAEWKPQRCIVGMPYTQDGTETAHILRVKKFIQQLQQHSKLPVEMIDEHLSSYASTAYVKRQTKAAKPQLDAIAAAIIVETWLQDNACLYASTSD